VADQAVTEDLPIIDAVETEESNRYQPGVPVHIGKMNRVKCQLRAAALPVGALQQASLIGDESLYLLPAQATLVLVRPDEHKPFWAVPVISETLRTIRLDLGDENSGPIGQTAASGANAAEQHRPLGLEISAPRSPHIRKIAATAAVMAASPESRTPSGISSAPVDRLATTIGGYPAAQPHAGIDRLALTTPIPVANISLWGSGAGDGAEAATAQCSLVFSDDRRRRVACKVLAQAQQFVVSRGLEHIEAFLTQVASV